MEAVTGVVRDIVLNPPKNPIKPLLVEVSRLEGELAAKWADYALITYPYVTTRLYI